MFHQHRVPPRLYIGARINSALFYLYKIMACFFLLSRMFFMFFFVETFRPVVPASLLNNVQLILKYNSVEVPTVVPKKRPIALLLYVL